jgi:hypothetical protein
MVKRRKSIVRFPAPSLDTSRAKIGRKPNADADNTIRIIPDNDAIPPIIAGR